MKVQVSLELLNKIIKYLEQMPYAHVCHLLKELIDDVSGQEAPVEQPKEEEKHVDAIEE